MAKQGAAWLSEAATWLSTGCGMAQLKGAVWLS